MTDEQLIAIQNRHDAATPGPWRWADWGQEYGKMERPSHRFDLEVGAPDEPRMCENVPNLPTRLLTVEYFDGLETTPEQDQHNARFIAASWADVRDLLGEVRTLRAVLAQVDNTLRVLQHLSGERYTQTQAAEARARINLRQTPLSDQLETAREALRQIAYHKGDISVEARSIAEEALMQEGSLG